jgi:hypothetical protein
MRTHWTRDAIGALLAAPRLDPVYEAASTEAVE